MSLDSTGFTPESTQDILLDVQTDEKANIDPGIDLDPDQGLGQLNGVLVDRESSVQQLIQTAYNAFDPEAVDGFIQDALYQLNGITRKAATSSLTPGTVNLNATTVLPAGSLASVDGQPSVVFATAATVTANPTGAPTNYPVNFICTQTGPIQCNAGTLTVIAGAFTGWNAVNNTADAVPGRNVESDTTFRIRRRQSVQNGGGSTPGAISAALLNLQGVLTVNVFENLGDVIDVNGNPPHSMEILVFDGAVPTVADNTIAQAIWNSRAGGATLVGNTTDGIAIDANGNAQTVPFSRPVDQDVYLSIDVATKGIVPANAATLIATLVEESGNADLNPGAEVVALDLKSILYDSRKSLGYTWLYDVPALRLGLSPVPLNTANLPMTIRQLPLLDTSRIVVNFVPAT